MTVSQPLGIQILYLGEDDLIYCAQHQTEAVSRFDCAEGAALLTRCEGEGDVFATPAAGGAEVRCAVSFQTIGIRRDSFVSLKNCTLQEPDLSQRKRSARPSCCGRCSRTKTFGMSPRAAAPPVR